MRITNKSISHSCIGTSYENLETKWCFSFEEQDFDDPVLFKKFEYAEVTQRKYHDEICTWFKGNRTNTFCHDCKDKRKQKFIAMIEKFIVDNDRPIHLSYIKS